jgi:drug/metabolite transporter (DMT)-like permease
MGISSFQAIVFNYLTCIVTGSFMAGHIPDYSATISVNYAPWAIALGLSFIISFNITALTVRKNGLAVASVANKLSLVIPFLFSLYLYNEEAHILNISGVAIALLAVVLTCYPQQTMGELTKGFSWKYMLLPLVLFIGSGLIDTGIKYTEQKYVTDNTRDDFLVACFTVAFLSGAIIYLIRLLTKEIRFETRAIVAGICIGIPNYLSIWCLVIVLNQYGSRSAAIIPVNNIGIVFVSALVAAFFFREKLSVINWIGIILAILSILMITSAI